jgi:hypothetical protein
MAETSTTKVVSNIEVTHISGRISSNGRNVPDVIRWKDPISVETAVSIVKELGLGEICNGVCVFKDNKPTDQYRSIDVWSKPKSTNAVSDAVTTISLKIAEALNRGDMATVITLTETLKLLQGAQNAPIAPAPVPATPVVPATVASEVVNLPWA